MIKKTFLLSCLILLSVAVIAQKKAIDHTVYNDWKSLSSSKVSDNGKYVSFEINPHRGDGFLHWANTKTNQHDSISRGNNARFSHDSDVLLFTIEPGFDTIRKLKLEKVKKEKWVKDTLGILFLQNDSLKKISNLIDFKVPEQGSFFAYRILSDSIKSIEKKKKKCKLFGKKTDEVPLTSKGETLFIENLLNGTSKTIENVVKYDFTENGKTLSIITHLSIEKADSFSIHLLDLSSLELSTHDEYFTEISSMNFSEKGNLFAFIASSDTSENKVNSLYLWPKDEDMASRIVHSERSDLATPMNVSANFTPRFSNNEKRLFLGLEDLPEEEVEDSLLESEKAKLDVWHYKNNRLQPQQLLEKKRDKEDSYYSILHIKENKLIQLEDDTLSVRLIDKGDGGFAMGTSNERYAHSYNWSFPWPSDYYTVNLNTGERKLIGQEVNYSQGISPDGKYFVYFVSDSNNYYFKNTLSGETDCMTCFIKDSIDWKRDINGMPHKAGPIGVSGFLSPTEVVLHSKYDIWTYNFTGRKLVSLTEQKGAYMNTELRLRRWDYDSTYIDLSKTYIHAINQETMDESIYNYEKHENHSHLTLLYESNHKILGLSKADKSEEVIFRQMNVTDYPDLYLSNSEFDSPKKISVTNPQQSEYIWPTVEKVSWTSYEGRKLDGLLYKPENFDSTKNYPMIVYFYELYTQRKHNHYIPKPTASIIYATEYTSAGYIVFIPDVRYTPGHPAKSAYDCILSGTDHVLELYPNIDSTRMGLQGQSWGGYQTAQLVTMTDRYAAGMAGAPVSNMFSAYGGIRWGSGLNRAFQYERTQSRIGKTIWEAPELYRENSPLFGVPNINTPLLIMHNDGDGAVPWYQGIEMFTAMKRLNKPVWMLNYNGDQHNLMKNANRMDLSIRMRQFFDYYLQGKPAPEWLIDGIPATEKGDNYGLEEYEED